MSNSFEVSGIVKTRISREGLKQDGRRDGGAYNYAAESQEKD